MKWAFVGDLQIPYDDPRAVALWFKVMKWWKPDAIDIVGDIDDQLEYSKYAETTTDEFFNKLKLLGKENEKAMAAWEKVSAAAEGDNPEAASGIRPPDLHDLDPLPFVKKNADGAKQFYAKVRKQHPKADIHASLGNHDIRIFGYIDRKAPEYNDQITPNLLWGLDDQGITWKMYHERPFERFAGIHVHHGTTTSTTGPTVGKDIESMDISLVRGHSHKALVAFKSYPLSGRVLQGLECGHMCDINGYGLQYADNPQWQQGFGIGHVTAEGKVSLQFIPIHADYTCVVDGRLFNG
jgi:hypothetical protein